MSVKPKNSIMQNKTDMNTNTKRARKPHAHEILCDTIKKNGYKVYVTYNRRIKGTFLTEDGFKATIDDVVPLHELRAKNMQHLIFARGGSIKATVAKGNEVVAETVVNCSDKDNFNKARGLVSAYARLYQTLLHNNLLKWQEKLI